MAKSQAPILDLPAGYEPPVDHLGVVVEPGDRIVVAFRSGDSAEIRTGYIRGYGTKKSYYSPTGEMLLLDVEWEKGYVKNSKIETSHKRFVKIPG